MNVQSFLNFVKIYYSFNQLRKIFKKPQPLEFKGSFDTGEERAVFQLCVGRLVFHASSQSASGVLSGDTLKLNPQAEQNVS